MAATWSSDLLIIYHNQQLCLAIANDLSIALGSTRVDWKVRLMQLWPQFNSYNLMHNEVESAWKREMGGERGP
jgi:hypothetical protein